MRGLFTKVFLSSILILSSGSPRVLLKPVEVSLRSIIMYRVNGHRLNIDRPGSARLGLTLWRLHEIYFIATEIR